MSVENCTGKKKNQWDWSMLTPRKGQRPDNLTWKKNLLNSRKHQISIKYFYQWRLELSATRGKKDKRKSKNTMPEDTWGYREICHSPCPALQLKASLWCLSNSSLILPRDGWFWTSHKALLIFRQHLVLKSISFYWIKVPYFALYNTLPCIIHTHIFTQTFKEKILLL